MKEQVKDILNKVYGKEETKMSERKYIQKRYNEDMKEIAKEERTIADLEKRLDFLKRTTRTKKQTLNTIKEKYNLK